MSGARLRGVGDGRLPVTLGVLSALVAVPYAAVWTVQMLVLTGGDRFFLLTTLVGFGILGPLWSALSVWSIVAARRRRSRVPAVIALVSTGVCGILTVLTLFI